MQSGTPSRHATETSLSSCCSRPGVLWSPRLNSALGSKRNTVKGDGRHNDQEKKLSLEHLANKRRRLETQSFFECVRVFGAATRASSAFGSCSSIQVGMACPVLLQLVALLVD